MNKFNNSEVNDLKGLIERKKKETLNNFLTLLTDTFFTQPIIVGQDDEVRNKLIDSFGMVVATVLNALASPSLDELENSLRQIDNSLTLNSSDSNIKAKIEEHRKEAEALFNENVGFRKREENLEKKLTEKEKKHSQEVKKLNTELAALKAEREVALDCLKEWEKTEKEWIKNSKLVLSWRDEIELVQQDKYNLEKTILELHEKLEEEQKKNQGNLQHLAKSKKYYEDAERLVNNAEERVNALEERGKDLLNQLVELELENFKLTQQRPRSDSGSSSSSANMLSRRSSWKSFTQPKKRRSSSVRNSLSLDMEFTKKGGEIDEFGRLITFPSPSPSPPSVSKRNSLSYFDSIHPYISSSFSPSSFFPSAEKILLENKIKRSEEEIQWRVKQIEELSKKYADLEKEINNLGETNESLRKANFNLSIELSKRNEELSNFLIKSPSSRSRRKSDSSYRGFMGRMPSFEGNKGRINDLAGIASSSSSSSSVYNPENDYSGLGIIIKKIQTLAEGGQAQVETESDDLKDREIKKLNEMIEVLRKEIINLSKRKNEIVEEVESSPEIKGGKHKNCQRNLAKIRELKKEIVDLKLKASLWEGLNETNVKIRDKKIAELSNRVKENDRGEKNWKNIHAKFTLELQAEWESKGFSYEQTQDWIGVGLGIKDADFATWLRDEKKVDANWLLNEGDEPNLRKEYENSLDWLRSKEGQAWKLRRWERMAVKRRAEYKDYEAKAQAEIARINDKWDEEAKEDAEVRRKLEEELEATQKELAEKDKKIWDLEVEKFNWEENEKYLNGRINEEIEIANGFRGENEELSERIKELENKEPCEVAEHADLKDRIISLNKANLSLKEKLTELEKELAQIKFGLTQKSLQKQALQEKLIQSEYDLKQASLTLLDMWSKMDSLETSQGSTKPTTSSEIDLSENKIIDNQIGTSAWSVLRNKLNQLPNPGYWMKKNAGKIALALGTTNLASYKVGEWMGNSETPISQLVGFTNATHSWTESLNQPLPEQWQDNLSPVQNPLLSLSLSAEVEKINSTDFVSYGEGSNHFSRDLVNYEKQNRKQGRKIIKLEKSLSTWTEQFSGQKAKEVKSELTELKLNQTELKIERDQWKTKYEEVELKLTDLLENWKEQLDSISDLNKDKEEKTEKINELTKKKNSLKDEIEARNRQINKRAGKNHQFNQDLITANQTIYDLEKEKDDLTSQRDNRPNITLSEHGELTQKINNLTNQTDTLQTGKNESKVDTESLTSLTTITETPEVETITETDTETETYTKRETQTKTITERETETLTSPPQTITENQTITTPATLTETETLTPPTITRTETISNTETETEIQKVSPTNLPLDWEVKLKRIPKLKKENNYLNATISKMEKERDGLLKDKEKELLAKQKVENTLNQTRINFDNYQNSTDLTIAEKDNKIKALDIKLENQDLVYSKNITRLEAEKSGLDSTIINKQIELENLTTEINKLNNDLLTVKDSDKFEIVRLKSENKNYKKQRDGRPNISFSEYEELLAEQQRQKGEITELQKRPAINITETEWEEDWSQRPTSKVYQELEADLLEEKKEHKDTKKDLKEVEKKVKIAEEFGLTDWEKWEHQTELETLASLLARPTRKELEGKQKEVNQLTTEINRVNDNLLTLKEGDRLEIARLKSEGKNYKKQRDSRTDISFTEYEELLTEKGNLNTTLTETIQNLTDARSEITERDGAIGKLEEDNKFLTGTNRAYREFIEELTGPGIAEKIVKKSFSNHPGKSAVGTAALGYLAKEYLKKWRNIPKVEQLEKEKKEQESKLTKKIGQLMVELSSEKIKNKQLAKDKKLLAKSTQVLYKDAEWLKREHKEGEKLIKKLRHRIAEIKKFYKEELQKVQTKLPSLALIKYEPSQEISERDTQFDSSLQKTFSLMVKEIENLQLKACSETYHQRIRLEQEKEVINQINTDCKLGCGSDSNLNQVISKIKELIDTPGASWTVIIQSEKETMKELLSSRLFTTYSEQLDQITNYQQLTTCRFEIIKTQLDQNQQTSMVSPADSSLFDTKNILAGSLIVNFLMIGAMLIMKSRKRKILDPLPSKDS